MAQKVVGLGGDPGAQVRQRLLVSRAGYQVFAAEVPERWFRCFDEI
jgi:hypothetical protein